MNIRNVLKTYSLLRALSDDESALLSTLRAMNDTERELLMESLSPSAKGTKKASKKAGKGASKSARASSLQQQLQTAAKLKADHCTFLMKANGGQEEMCEAKPDDPIHDETFGYAGYHPFASSSPARSAAKGSSSKNGSLDASAVNSEAGMESASSVTGD